MSIQDAKASVVYSGSGSVGPFALRDENGNQIEFWDNSHIHAIHRSSTGTETVLVEGTDYTLTGGPLAGELLLTTALAVGTKLAIYRAQPLDQTTSFALAGDFASEDHTKALDKARLIDQEIREDLARAVKLPRFSAQTDSELPYGESKLLGYNASGEIVLYDPDTLVPAGEGDTLDDATIAAYLTANAQTARENMGLWVGNSATTTAPPGTIGGVYLIPTGATGAWASHVGKIADGRSTTAWSYKTAGLGWMFDAKDTDRGYYHDGTAWVVRQYAPVSASDGRIVGIAKTNGHSGARWRAHFTADQRLVLMGDVSGLGYDGGDNWGPYEVPWDASANGNITTLYAGINYLLILTDAATGNVWHLGGADDGQGGHGNTTTQTVPKRIDYFQSNSVNITAIWTEQSVGNTDKFWFAKSSTNTLYGCGAGANYTQGNNATSDVSTPHLMTFSDASTVSNVSEVACSTVYAPVWVLRTDGSAVRWGSGTDGAHANGSTSDLTYPEVLGGGTPQTGISKIAVTGSNVGGTARAVTAMIVSGKGKFAGSRYHGSGDGAALTSAAVNTLTDWTGAIASETLTKIYAGGGDYPNLGAVDAAGYWWQCGHNAKGQHAAGNNTSVSTMFKPTLPTGYAGNVVAGAIAGGNQLNAIFVEADVSAGGVNRVCAAGYDTRYNTGKSTTGVAAASMTFGAVLGQRGTISAWQIVGDNDYYGIEMLLSTGELRYAGANDQGQAGSQPGNLHDVQAMQPTRTTGIVTATS